MKRALIAVLAVLVFIVVLCVHLPAAWVLPALRTQLRCGEVEGTVWHAECTHALVHGIALDQLTWHVHAAALLRGRLTVQVRALRHGASASGELSLPWRGPLSARNVFARLRVEPAILPVVPAYISGTIEAHLERALIARDGAIEHLRGRITLLHLIDSSGEVTPLGSYTVTFPGGGGEPIGRLHDLGTGPLALRGTLRLTSAPGYVLQAELAPRASASTSLLQALQYLGPPDDSGRRPFALQGTY